MAVPKRKVSPMKIGHRRSGHRKESVTVVMDAMTGEYKRPHHIDLKTGKYGERVVIPPVEADSPTDEAATAEG